MARVKVESLMMRYPHGVLFTVAKKLVSPNAMKTWQAKHWESQSWERALKAAFEVQRLPWLELDLTPWIPSEAEPIQGGRLARVLIRRLVPTKASLLKDDDNIEFMRKPVHDALVRLAFIPADTKAALEKHQPIEAISRDGHFWTQIFISPIPAILRRQR